MIAVQMENRHGKGLKFDGEKAMVVVQLESADPYLNQQHILVDDYVGTGIEYRRRKTTRIVIKDHDKIFEFGSFTELIDRLEGK